MEVVVQALNRDDVVATLKYANENNIPVTTRGAGVGYVGGCVPVKGGILLSVRKMDRIVEEGELAINEFVEQTPTADRQKLRQLWRNLQRAGSEAKKTQHSRLIYRNIKDYLDY